MSLGNNHGSVKDKVNYVLRKTNLTNHRHTCHYPGCTSIVKPQFWGCTPHWFALPAWARSMIWATYKPGQEISKNPSAGYLEVVAKIHIYIIASETWNVIRSRVAAGNYSNLGVEHHPL